MATYEEMMQMQRRPPGEGLPRTVYFETTEDDDDSSSDSDESFLGGGEEVEDQQGKDTVVIETILETEREAKVHPRPSLLFVVPAKAVQDSQKDTPPQHTIAELPIEEIPTYQLPFADDCDLDLPCIWDLWGCGIST